MEEEKKTEKGLKDRQLLSVILPIYNAAKFIRPCLDSLLGQSYKNIELILMDDGSKDDTPNILDSYAKVDSRVRVFHKKNEGSATSRNRGIDVARGSLLSFIDADDVLDLDMFEILVGSLEETGSDIAACSFVCEYSEKFDVVNRHCDIPKSVIFSGTHDIMMAYVSKTRALTGYVWNKVYKKTALGTCRFKEGLSFGDDVLFSWMVLAGDKVKTVSFVDLPMYHYRISKKSITRNASYQQSFNMISSYEYMLNQASSIDPLIVDELAIQYLERNTGAFGRLINAKTKDLEAYKIIRSNLRKYSKYIKKMSLKGRIAARSILSGYFIGKLVFRFGEIFKNRE